MKPARHTLIAGLALSLWVTVTPFAAHTSQAVQSDGRTNHDTRNTSCNPIQATPPMGLYNRGICHNLATGAVLISLPTEMTKNITHYNKSASVANYAIIAYELHEPLVCSNGIMLPIEPHTSTADLGFLYPGVFKIMLVRNAKVVMVTEKARGKEETITTPKYVGSILYSDIVENDLFAVGIAPVGHCTKSHAD